MKRNKNVLATDQVFTAEERTELERFRAALDATGDVVYEWNPRTDAISWSVNARERLGLDDSADISTREGFLACVAPSDQSWHDTGSVGSVRTDITYRLTRAEGRMCWVQDRSIIASTKDGQRVVGSLRMIESPGHEALPAQPEAEQSSDPYNHGQLRGRLEQALARKNDQEAAFLVVAVDNLAIVRDVCGHGVGESAVGSIGRELGRCLGLKGVAGQMAPDRFGIVIDRCEESALQTTAESVLQAIHQIGVPTPTGPIYLAASIGAVRLSTSMDCAEVTVDKAEIALEDARRIDRGDIAWYNLTDEERSSRR